MLTEKSFIGDTKEKSSKVRKSMTIDGMTYEINVEAVDGGFIVIKSMWGDKKLDKPNKDGRTTEYINKEKKYVTTKNPFDTDGDEEPETGFNLKSAIGSINEMDGFLNL